MKFLENISTIMDFEQIKEDHNHLLLKCISGSKAYNLQLPSSDTDIKGVYVMRKETLYGLTQVEQVSNVTNDEVYFEIRRFIDLLIKNNPNILELLSTPDYAILYRHPLMELIRPEDFLSRICFDTFAGYAKTQIKKARGLNKKINRPMEKERKSVLDFCYVISGPEAIPLRKWLSAKTLSQEDCGLVSIAHFRDAYYLYTNENLSEGSRLSGIISGASANDVQLSSVPKGSVATTIMHFNKDGYSVYCREYNDYWEWVDKRNEARYQNTMSHGKSYDAKNMMHTFRLLNMAEEIALYKKVIVYRSDREELLKIREGAFEYDELINRVEEKMIRIEALYSRSDLPDEPDTKKAEEILIQIRESFYRKNSN
jgi:hypothetical protein